MNMKEDIRPITFLKNRTAELLAQINKTHRPVVITQNGEARGVLQDTETYERMCRALGLLKLLSQSEEDIRKGRTVPQDEVFKQARKHLKSLVGKNGKTANL
jgi:prevent-host-death family protein